MARTMAQTAVILNHYRCFTQIAFMIILVISMLRTSETKSGASPDLRADVLHTHEIASFLS